MFFLRYTYGKSRATNSQPLSTIERILLLILISVLALRLTVKEPVKIEVKFPVDSVDIPESIDLK